MWIILAGSLVALAYKPTISIILLAISLALALKTQVLDPMGLAFVIAILVLSYMSYHLYHSIFSKILEPLLVLSVIGLTLHLIPGIHNFKILHEVYIGENSPLFSQYLNLDKAIVPFILLACMPSLFITQPLNQVRHINWTLLTLAIPALLFIALFCGAIAFESHFPKWISTFILANVFFVSLAEEAIFRGYLQQRLSQWVNPYIALMISALAFGLFHFAGGYLFVIFATLAGIIYGLAWMWSGRLWVATFFHFALNLCHLLFFTYPVYKH